MTWNKRAAKSLSLEKPIFRNFPCATLQCSHFRKQPNISFLRFLQYIRNTKIHIESPILEHVMRRIHFFFATQFSALKMCV